MTVYNKILSLLLIALVLVLASSDNNGQAKNGFELKPAITKAVIAEEPLTDEFLSDTTELKSLEYKFRNQHVINFN